MIWVLFVFVKIFSNLSFASSEGFEVDNIEYNFVDSKKMYSLNKDYLDHTTDTDIITFDYSENKTISAEVYISKDMMIENAKENSQTLENERIRLLSHALFHCMGYKDKSPNEKNKGNLTFVAVSSIIRYIIWRFKWQRKKVSIM